MRPDSRHTASEIAVYLAVPIHVRLVARGVPHTERSVAVFPVFVGICKRMLGPPLFFGTELTQKTLDFACVVVKLSVRASVRGVSGLLVFIGYCREVVHGATRVFANPKEGVLRETRCLSEAQLSQSRVYSQVRRVAELRY